MNRSKLKNHKSNLTKISEVINTVKDNLGLDKQYKIMALKEIWPLVTSFKYAELSYPAYFDKDGNLVIAAKSGTLATELSMQKISIEKKLKEATKNTDITFKSIRFIHR